MRKIFEHDPDFWEAIFLGSVVGALCTLFVVVILLNFLVKGSR